MPVITIVSDMAVVAEGVFELFGFFIFQAIIGSGLTMLLLIEVSSAATRKGRLVPVAG